ncbi:hypothetical protein QFZ20_003021 [Flavobacterium sp. W4I14]|nr:hypothetical protein [Flavobacterium sp. W4I14]
MNVSLQINVAPSDYPHVQYILKKQLEILSNQVNEIIVTIDSIPSKGRFATGWHENKDNLTHYLYTEIVPYFNVKIQFVDYSSVCVKEVSNFFFCDKLIPAKDFRGGPFYAYFFGIFSAKNNFVFHLDSDIILGGGSSRWIAEALEKFQSKPTIFVISPLPGPPHPQQLLVGQSDYQKIEDYVFQFKRMSTRIFIVDKSRFQENKLKLTKPSFRNQIKAVVEGNPNADLPEHLISNMMSERGLNRIDFLGSDEGLWSLHPPFRNREFYQKLPQILSFVNDGNLPHAQFGFYDIVDEICDWSENRLQLRKNRWWKRIVR